MDTRISEKEFLVEMIVNFYYDNDTDLYQYEIKWLGFGPHHNCWLDEDKIPKHFVVEFWESMLTRNTKAYNARLKWAQSPKKKKAVRKAVKNVETLDVENSDTSSESIFIELPRVAMEDDSSC